MNWILSSLLMFTSSAFLYTYIRHVQKKGLTTIQTSIGMFFIPMLLYIAYAGITKASLLVSPSQFVILALSSFFLSWLGNWFSLRSIESSPNPGYSLIISKSYVVFTSIASIFLFSSPLTHQQAIGITLIVIFSAVIILSEKRKEHETHSLNWVWLSFGAFFCWGGLALVSKYLLNSGMNIVARLLYMHVFVVMILFLETRWRKESIRLSKLQIKDILPIGIFGFSFNLFMQMGFQSAPNPGFVNAMNAASISLVAILAAFLFNDDLSRKKMVGIAGVTVGMLFLFL